jgi:hypothetical protein
LGYDQTKEKKVNQSGDVRLDDGHTDGCRDGRVDRVAAERQDFVADGRARFVVAHNLGRVLALRVDLCSLGKLSMENVFNRVLGILFYVHNYLLHLSFCDLIMYFLNYYFKIKLQIF